MITWVIIGESERHRTSQQQLQDNSSMNRLSPIALLGVGNVDKVFMLHPEYLRTTNRRECSVRMESQDEGRRGLGETTGLGCFWRTGAERDRDREKQTERQRQRDKEAGVKGRQTRRPCESSKACSCPP